MELTHKKAVLDRIDQNRDKIIDFLKRLIEFPSVTGDEAEIQEFVAKKLRSMGLEVDMWEPDLEALKKHPAYVEIDKGYENRPNVVGIYKGSGGGRSLLLNGHVDVIPPGPREVWDQDPFFPKIDGGRMYGRGTADMKSGVAAYTMAVDTLLELGIGLKGDIFMEYVVDEERTGNGTLDCVIKGYKADAGISCETSSMRVQPGCIGRIWFEILVKGKPAGIQRRFEGVSGIEKGYEIVKAVSEYEAIRIETIKHHLYPDLLTSIPCMVGQFNSGTFSSSFPDLCVLKGSIATVPGEDNDEVMQGLTDHIIAHSKKDPWLCDHLPEVKFNGYCGDAAEIPVDHPIVTTLCDHYTDVLGREPEISGRQGAADIRYLIKYGETPTVIFGPGGTEVMHSNNESVGLDDLIDATKTLSLTIMEWCGVS